LAKTIVAWVSAPQIPGFHHVYSGKVRDLYVPDDSPPGGGGRDRVLVVASDRISAYDYVLTSTIPDKGRVLTSLSVWWFEQLADLVPHHVISTDVPDVVAGRALLCERLEMVEVECVARGYLAGSGLVDYLASGAVCGIDLPPGLMDGSRLPAPIFTPATKAPLGDHDENVRFDYVEQVAGDAVADQLRKLTLEVYARGETIARERGIIVADTKLEFGRRADGTIVLADEVLTPDSSRFWPAESWEPGRAQPSFDKQFVRDWLTSPASGWHRLSGSEPPPLPEDIVARTRDRYVDAYERMTGRTFR
jgi:phosphoribosylaminoimidazole-succinocarboxamide synthase